MNVREIREKGKRNERKNVFVCSLLLGDDIKPAGCNGMGMNRPGDLTDRLTD